MRKRILGSMILAMLSTTAAVASQTWTGLYAGVNGGYGWGNQSVTMSGSTTGGAGSLANAIAAGSIPASIAGNPSGGLGGLEIGYNYAVNTLLVMGAITDYDWAGVSANQTVSTKDIPYSIPGVIYAPATTKARQSLQSFGTVRVLVGLTPSSYPVLAYLTAGFGYGSVKTSASYSNIAHCAGFCGSNTSSNTNTGWVGGGGLAYPFYTNWSIKAEYLYYNLGSLSQQILDPRFPALFLKQNVAFKGNAVRAGIDYKFM